MAMDGYEVHGLGLYIAWGCLSWFVAVSGRYFSRFYRSRMIIHAVCSTIILIMNPIFVAF